MHWIELAKRGIDVIVDFGFWAGSERDAARRAAAAIAAHVGFYWLTCSDRVAGSAASAATAIAMWTTSFDEGAFDALRERFKLLASDEEHEVISTSDE